jgi:hypothetical protein
MLSSSWWWKQMVIICFCFSGGENGSVFFFWWVRRLNEEIIFRESMWIVRRLIKYCSFSIVKWNWNYHQFRQFMFSCFFYLRLNLLIFSSVRFKRETFSSALSRREFVLTQQRSQFTTKIIFSANSSSFSLISTKQHQPEATQNTKKNLKFIFNGISLIGRWDEFAHTTCFCHRFHVSS